MDTKFYKKHYDKMIKEAEELQVLLTEYREIKSIKEYQDVLNSYSDVIRLLEHIPDAIISE